MDHPRVWSADTATSSQAVVELEAYLDVSRRVAEYFLRTNRPEFGGAAELFNPDGTLELGGLRLAGRDTIAAFFAERNAQRADNGRVTRHLFGPADPQGLFAQADLQRLKANVARRAATAMPK